MRIEQPFHTFAPCGGNLGSHDHFDAGSSYADKSKLKISATLESGKKESFEIEIKRISKKELHNNSFLILQVHHGGGKLKASTLCVNIQSSLIMHLVLSALIEWACF